MSLLPVCRAIRTETFAPEARIAKLLPVRQASNEKATALGPDLLVPTYCIRQTVKPTQLPCICRTKTERGGTATAVRRDPLQRTQIAFLNP